MIDGAFTAVTLVALLFAGVNCIVCARLLTRERRESARAEQRWEIERSRLIDQMCNLADKPWSPPPARVTADAATAERSPATPDEELAVW